MLRRAFPRVCLPISRMWHDQWSFKTAPSLTRIRYQCVHTPQTLWGAVTYMLVSPHPRYQRILLDSICGRRNCNAPRAVCGIPPIPSSPQAHRKSPIRCDNLSSGYHTDVMTVCISRKMETGLSRRKPRGRS